MVIDYAKGVAARAVASLRTDREVGRIGTMIRHQATTPRTPTEMYERLRYYHNNNGLYDILRDGIDVYQSTNPAGVPYVYDAIKGLRNPAKSVVAFYVASLAAGRAEDAFEITVDKPSTANATTKAASDAQRQRLIDAIHKVWEWSNWSAQVKVAVRSGARDGDLFVRVGTNGDLINGVAPTRVAFQIIDAVTVTSIDADERGFLVFVRIDTPIGTGAQGYTGPTYRTEVWDKAAAELRVYLHRFGPGAKEDQLGTAQTFPLTPDGPIGTDFVPIVQIKFMDLGDLRGVGAYALDLDMIDAACLEATRLSQQLFRHNGVFWGLESQGGDPTGQMAGEFSVDASGAPSINNAPVPSGVTISQERVSVIPAGWTLKSTVPALPYDAALAVLNATVAEIEKRLPEVLFSRLMEVGGGSEMSGRALRFTMAPAVAKAEEFRSALHHGLVRLDQIALTMAQALKLPGFENLGTYASGALDHGFVERPIIPLSDAEEAQAEQQKWATAQIQLDIGIPLREVLRLMNMPDEDIDRIVDASEKEAAVRQERQQAQFASQPTQLLAAARAAAARLPGQNGATA